MQEIRGVHIETGWVVMMKIYKFGDEHEIRLQQMEQIQQKNEEDDHVQKDIISQVQKIGGIYMTIGMRQNHLIILFESR